MKELYLKVGLEKIQERTKTMEKVSKSSFEEGMNLKKAQKQGRDERIQEDYIPYICCVFACIYNLLAFLHICIVSVFSGPSLFEKNFCLFLIPFDKSSKKLIAELIHTLFRESWVRILSESSELGCLSELFPSL